MPHFTITGYYPDNRQPWATSCEAVDVADAEIEAKELIAESLFYEREDTREMSQAEIRAGVLKLANDLTEIVSTGVIYGDHKVYGGDFEHGDS